MYIHIHIRTSLDMFMYLQSQYPIMRLRLFCKLLAECPLNKTAVHTRIQGAEKRDKNTRFRVREEPMLCAGAGRISPDVCSTYSI